MYSSRRILFSICVVNYNIVKIQFKIDPLVKKHEDKVSLPLSIIKSIYMYYMIILRLWQIKHVGQGINILCYF